MKFIKNGRGVAVAEPAWESDHDWSHNRTQSIRGVIGHTQVLVVVMSPVLLLHHHAQGTGSMCIVTRVAALTVCASGMCQLLSVHLTPVVLQSIAAGSTLLCSAWESCIKYSGHSSTGS